MNEKFEQVRRFFPHTNKIVFFNTAAFSPMSTPIKEAIDANFDIRMAAEIDDTRQMYELRERVREGYAELIGAETRQVGVSINTSFGLDLASYGLPLKEGDEILLSDIEFPATIYAWRGAAETRKLKISYIKSKERKFDIPALENAITERSRVLSISFVQFFNGFKNDLKRLSEICQKHNLFFVVDGIQGAGAEPINVAELDIDIFSAGCQKWLLAPFGSGFYYISDKVKDQLTSHNITWYSSNWEFQFSDLFKYNLPYFDTAEKFQGGYYATLNLLGMEASQKIILDLGIDNIQRHNHRLIDIIVETLKESDYYKITSSLKPGERSSILTIACDKLTELHRYLFSQKIYVACREGSVRIAVHLFNNESDVEKLLEALKKFEKSNSRNLAGKTN
ncbi:MAG TPA: aminotransferase class V-fold PLP-dependent enzyme [candidate division Zixibacteria bacterium]|nr:aminotransferase class V-fold PLP-dependent enzyme [candidate division Zixibacteria bacterium]